MSKAPKLQPCPFCGGKPKTDAIPIIGGVFDTMIYCTGCGIRTQYMRNTVDLIAKWNVRAEGKK